MRIGREIDDTYINADRLRRGEKSTKIIIDYVDGGHAEVSGGNERGYLQWTEQQCWSPYHTPTLSCLLLSSILLPFSYVYVARPTSPLLILGVFAGRITGSRHLRVTRSFINSCSSASVYSLPCRPRIAEDNEFFAPSRLKSAGAGDYTGGEVVGAEAEERSLKAGAAAALWYRRRECWGWFIRWRR